MADSQRELQDLARSAMQALVSGDARRARENFERVISQAQVDASVHLGHAYACRALKDLPSARAAVDRVLALEPRNLRALVLKGDCLVEAGDLPTASSFYSEALRTAPPMESLPEDLRREVERARGALERVAGIFETGLRERLASQGLDQEEAARFRESLEILFGRQSVQFQQPRFYFMPGLPQRYFYERAEFPWIEGLEAAAGDIRAEAEALLEDESGFRPYVQSNPNLPHRNRERMVDNPDWSAFYLWKFGEPVAENLARCPRTAAALQAVPLACSPNRSPSVLFSLLRPGAHIPAHRGMVNTRLIAHLPLIVPGKCRFRVGNEIREWVEGRAWVFDDTMEHEAWNGSDRRRVVLIFEIWQPALTPAERDLVNAMFTAIDTQTGQRPDWEI
jgi:hypothetical protein